MLSKTLALICGTRWRDRTFARVVFVGAGIWGLVVLTPLFFLVDVAGRPYPAPTEYPHFFYGFLSIALAWQVAFLVIGRDPERYRPLMVAAILEKVGYVVGTGVLFAQARLTPEAAESIGPDALLAMLFVVAFATSRTRSAPGTAAWWPAARRQPGV